MRSIYVRSMPSDGQKNQNLNAIKAVGISNELYGNTLVSAFEMAKGYPTTIIGKPKGIPDDIIKAN